MKWGRVIVKSILGLLAVGCIGVVWVSRDELLALHSVHKVNDTPLYEMTYKGDYGLDEYLKVGAKTTDELASFITKQVTHGVVNNLQSDQLQHGCSGFIAQTPDGDIIFARDLDQKVENIAGIVHTSTDTGYDTIGMCNLSWCGWEDDPQQLTLKNRVLALGAPYLTLDGMNEYGLAYALLTASGSVGSYDEEKVSLFDFTVGRVCLDQAKTVDEAIALLQNYNVALMPSCPSHYFLADAEGNSAVIEFTKGEMQVVEKTESYQICTNFILYNNPKHSGYGADRYKAYDEALSASQGVITTDDALSLLEAHTIPGDARWSVVYNLTQKTMDLAVYPDYDKVYHYAWNGAEWIQAS